MKLTQIYTQAYHVPHEVRVIELSTCFLHGRKVPRNSWYNIYWLYVRFLAPNMGFLFMSTACGMIISDDILLLYLHVQIYVHVWGQYCMRVTCNCFNDIHHHDLAMHVRSWVMTFHCGHIYGISDIMYMYCYSSPWASLVPGPKFLIMLGRGPAGYLSIACVLVRIR